MGRVPPRVIKLSIQPRVLSKNDNKVVPNYNVIKYPGPRPRQQVKAKDQQQSSLAPSQAAELLPTACEDARNTKADNKTATNPTNSQDPTVNRVLQHNNSVMCTVLCV